MDNTNPPLMESLLALFLEIGSVWVLYLLIILSVLATAVIFERAVFFLLQRTNPAAMRRSLLAALRTEGGTAALETLGKDKALPAEVARACLENIDAGSEAVEEHAASIIETQRLRYERGLAFLGTLGNNAPFIGLFGTVLGIIRAFNDLAIQSSAGSEAVMAGIAEALVATAVGLLVALPAVAAYNIFSRNVQGAITGADAITHAILAHIKTSEHAAASDQGGE